MKTYLYIQNHKRYGDNIRIDNNKISLKNSSNIKTYPVKHIYSDTDPLKRNMNLEILNHYIQ